MPEDAPRASPGGSVDSLVWCRFHGRYERPGNVDRWLLAAVVTIFVVAFLVHYVVLGDPCAGAPATSGVCV